MNVKKMHQPEGRDITHDVIDQDNANITTVDVAQAMNEFSKTVSERFLEFNEALHAFKIHNEKMAESMHYLNNRMNEVKPEKVEPATEEQVDDMMLSFFEKVAAAVNNGGEKAKKAMNEQLQIIKEQLKISEPKKEEEAEEKDATFLEEVSDVAGKSWSASRSTVGLTLAGIGGISGAVVAGGTLTTMAINSAALAGVAFVAGFAGQFVLRGIWRTGKWVAGMFEKDPAPATA